MIRNVIDRSKETVTNWIDCARRAVVGGAALIAGSCPGERNMAAHRALAVEPLEPRLPLSAAGLVDVGTQPDGGLTGKIVYVHGGHGYTANNQTNGAWSFQRGELFEMIEDLGNVDQMNYLVDYLFQAGATVAPLRPVGHQENEVVLDNDSPGVAFSGTWSDSSGSVYFGEPGDVPYRFATTSETETAYARYQPNIPEAGYYPIYTWAAHGGNRATDQLYRVHHAGGATEVTVNHRRVGNGLVYLGTYYFEAGTEGWVDISNRSNAPGSVVIADMIRFGNGMGDIARGGGVSGRPREDEAGLYWVKWHVDRSEGIPDSEYRATSNDRDATVSLSPRYAEFMNREQDGSLSDRVFVSFHSNAAGGRGVTALHNTSHGGDTPNQVLLARSLAQEVNNDLVAQNGMYEHNWFNRGTNVLYESPDFNYGELNNNVINDEFDATILEVAFHDNQLDAELMRDPKVRDAIARATYQGLVKYFRAVDGNTTPVQAAPGAVSNVRAVSNAEGEVTISWQPPAANSYGGDSTEGYRIYASTHGRGFDGGTYVAGGASSTFTLSGYDPTLPYFFKIVAINEGGESPSSEVVAALPSGGAKQVLIVNGFDRLDRSLNAKAPFGGGGNTVDRVRTPESNSRDYAVQVATAIHTAAPGVHVSGTSNEAVIIGAVNLTKYDTVIWILGEESTADDTFSAAEQTKVEQFIAAGGNLFLSGAEIGWDLDSQNNGRAFYEGTLSANFVSDDANSYSATGTGGGIFAGLNVRFDNGNLFYNADFPDVIAAQPGSQLAMTYANGAGGAAIQALGSGGRGSVVMFGFPFETLTIAANRAAVMDRVLEFFGTSAVPVANADFNGDGLVDAADYTIWRDNRGNSVPAGTQGDANGDGQVDDDDYGIWKQQFGTVQGAAAATGTSASVPPALPAVTTFGGDNVPVSSPLKPVASGAALDWLRPTEASWFERRASRHGAPTSSRGDTYYDDEAIARNLLTATLTRRNDAGLKPSEVRSDAFGPAAAEFNDFVAAEDGVAARWEALSETTNSKSRRDSVT